MQKGELVISGLFVSVLSVVSGIMFDQVSAVNDELDRRTEFVYQIPALKDDITEIKEDISEIQGDIKQLLKESSP